MLTQSVRSIILRLVALYYPRIELRGAEHLPSGPALFVLNHPNGLLDPLVLMLALRRHVAFLAKSTFFANPIGRIFMQAFGALPVYRTIDEGQAGGAQGDRASRNEQTFARCRALLRAGQALALFPEGTTHSKTTMLPLRSGAARIALSAEDEAGWDMRLQVVPVGLWYERKWQFRSAALVVVGEAFELSAYQDAYHTDERAAADQLTEQIDERLDRVVLQAENAELLSGIATVAAWTAPQELATLDARHARASELLASYQRLRISDPERLETIADTARRYARVLRTLGIDDPWQLELSGARRGRIAQLLFWLILGAAPALAGAILSYGPYRLAAPLAPRLLGEYEETLSTGKLIIGSVLVGLAWLIEALVCGWLFGAGWGVALLLLAPALAYIALRWGASWRELREVLAYSWLSMRHQALVRELTARRQALAALVVEALQATSDLR